jgi:hypothetical protein
VSQHLGRLVNRDNAVAELDKRSGDPASASAQFENRCGRIARCLMDDLGFPACPHQRVEVDRASVWRDDAWPRATFSWSDHGW